MDKRSAHRSPFMSAAATYLGSAAQCTIDQLQAELKDHSLTGVGGRCATCGETEPCRRRGELHLALLGYGQLPKRQPGLTRRPPKPVAAQPFAFFGSNQ